MTVPKKIFAALAVLYAPGLWVIAATADGGSGVIVVPPILIFILLLAATAPFYFLFLELGFLVGRIVARKTTTRREQAYGAACLGLALIGVVCLLLNSTAEHEALVAVVIAADVLAALLRIVGLFVFRTHRAALGVFKKGSLWLIAAGLLVALIVVCVLARELPERKNKPDPEVPRETVAEITYRIH